MRSHWLFLETNTAKSRITFHSELADAVKYRRALLALPLRDVCSGHGLHFDAAVASVEARVCRKVGVALRTSVTPHAVGRSFKIQQESVNNKRTHINFLPSINHDFIRIGYRRWKKLNLLISKYCSFPSEILALSLLSKRFSFSLRNETRRLFRMNNVKKQHQQWPILKLVQEPIFQRNSRLA